MKLICFQFLFSHFCVDNSLSWIWSRGKTKNSSKKHKKKQMTWSGLCISIFRAIVKWAQSLNFVLLLPKAVSLCEMWYLPTLTSSRFSASICLPYSQSIGKIIPFSADLSITLPFILCAFIQMRLISLEDYCVSWSRCFRFILCTFLKIYIDKNMLSTFVAQFSVSFFSFLLLLYSLSLLFFIACGYILFNDLTNFFLFFSANFSQTKIRNLILEFIEFSFNALKQLRMFLGFSF
jgi:hypothetical protein